MSALFEQVVLRDYLRIFYRHKIFFLIIPFVLILSAYIGLELKTPVYTASVKMFIRAVQKTEAEYYVGSTLGGDRTSEHMELVSSNIVLKRVVEALKLYERPFDRELGFASPLRKRGLENNFKEVRQQLNEMTPEQRKEFLFSNAMGVLRQNILTSPGRGSNLFEISVDDFTPGDAVRIANSISRSYIIFDLEQQIEELKLKYGEMHSTVLQLQNYIEGYKKTLDGGALPDLEALGPASVKIVAQAEEAWRSNAMPRNLIFLVLFFVGNFFAVLFSFIIEYFDNTFKTPKDLDKYLEYPFLGSIPKRKKKNELIMSDELLAKSSLKCVNSFQRLGDKICLLSKKENIKTILITAFNELSDTSALIANLGIYLSRDARKKVLIIDANLKNPTLGNVFHISENSGLPEVFERKKTFEEAIVNKGKNLDLLLSHTVSYRPITLLDSSFMADLIKEVRNKYDFVLIDCTVNLKQDTDPVILSSFTDAVILVVNEGIDKFQDAQVVVNNLNRNEGMAIFSVLNNRKEDMPKVMYKIS